MFLFANIYDVPFPELVDQMNTREANLKYDEESSYTLLALMLPLLRRNKHNGGNR